MKKPRLTTDYPTFEPGLNVVPFRGEWLAVFAFEDGFTGPLFRDHCPLWAAMLAVEGAVRVWRNRG